MTYEALALYIELALIYLLFCTVLTFLQRFIEKKIDVQNRKPKKISFSDIVPMAQRDRMGAAGLLYSTGQEARNAEKQGGEKS